MNRVKKSLGLLFPAMRISISLALITACMLLSADMLGYTLNEDRQALQNRKQIAESLAIQFSVMAPEKGIKKIEDVIRLIVERNPAILSAGLATLPGGPYSSLRTMHNSGKTMEIVLITIRRAQHG